MRVVIDIPEEEYNYVKTQVKFGITNPLKMRVANGTPLPKGHGDLIDRNSILCDDCSCEQCGHTDECFKLLAPTIIEADKAESDIPNFESEEYVEERLENYGKMLKSGILDCVKEEGEDNEDIPMEYFESGGI